MALPAIMVLFGNIEMFEKFFPNFIMTPLNIPSFIRIFDPAPSIKSFSVLPNSFKKKINSFKLSGLKYAFVYPPILNQLVFFKS